MLTDLRRQPAIFGVETAVLAVSAPFLLFPDRFPLPAAAALTALSLLWLSHLAYTRRPLPRTPFNLVLLLFNVAVLAGTAVSADPAWTLPKTAGILLGTAVWRYAVLYLRTPRLQFGLLLGSFLLGAGMIALGLLTVSWIPKVPGLDDLVRLSARVGIGTLDRTDVQVHSNQLAGTLLFFIPLSAALTIWWPPHFDRRGRWAIGAFTAGTLLIMLLTQSRGGWAGTVAGLAVLPWLYALVHRQRSATYRRAVWMAPLALLVCGLLGGILFGSQLRAVWTDPAVDTAVGSLDSLAFRQEVWRWAVVAIGDFPFTGTGLGAFREVGFRIYPINVRMDDIGHAHNLFLQIALDIGLPGLIAYLALVGLMIVAFLKAAHTAATSAAGRPSPPSLTMPPALGLIANLVALHTYGLLDALAFGSKTHLFFWLMLAAATLMILPTPRSSSDSKPPL